MNGDIREEGTSVEKMSTPFVGKSVERAFLNDSNGRTWHPLGVITPGRVVLGSVRKQAEQVSRSSQEAGLLIVSASMPTSVFLPRIHS